MCPWRPSKSIDPLVLVMVGPPDGGGDGGGGCGTLPEYFRRAVRLLTSEPSTCLAPTCDLNCAFLEFLHIQSTVIAEDLERSHWPSLLGALLSESFKNSAGLFQAETAPGLSITCHSTVCEVRFHRDLRLCNRLGTLRNLRDPPCS